MLIKHVKNILVFCVNLDALVLIRTKKHISYKDQRKNKENRSIPKSEANRWASWISLPVPTPEAFQLWGSQIGSACNGRRRCGCGCAGRSNSSSAYGCGCQNRFGMPSLFWGSDVGDWVNSPPILEPILVVGLGCSLGANRGFDPWPYR